MLVFTMENHGSRSGGSPARGKMPVRLSTSQRRLRPKRDDMSRTSTQHPPFTGRGQGNHGREHAARTRRLFIGCDASARPQLSGLGGARDGDPRSCCPGRRRGRPAFREGLTDRALTRHRPFHSESSPAAPGEQMAPLAQGQSWGQKRGPSTPDPMRFHLHPCSPPPLSR